MKSPLVSVIIPVKNGSNYIKEALEGIQLQNSDVEIIVVDDGSTDNCAQIAKDYDCNILIHNSSKGPTVAKNTALKIAKGKYIMFHDHDDVMTSNSLLKMVEELQKSQEIYAVMAQMSDFFSPELSDEEKRKIELKKEPYSGLFSGAILMKKEVFDIIGLFDESLKAGDVIDWSAKMSENNLRIKKLDFVSANRRIHNTNFGRTNKEKEFKDYASILRAKLKRTAT